MTRVAEVQANKSSGGCQQGRSDQTKCLTASHMQLPGATGRPALSEPGERGEAGERTSVGKLKADKNPSVAFEGRGDSFKI